MEEEIKKNDEGSKENVRNVQQMKQTLKKNKILLPFL